MSRVIAVYGSPESGKTVTALKLAQEIYERKKNRVLFVSPDLTVPMMGYVFPHCKASELYSLGEVLDRTDIGKEDILKQIVTVKTMENFGYLGFKAGENRYSYPHPTEDKIAQLFARLREIAEYIVLDCVSDPADFISAMCLKEADDCLQIISTDLKGMVYHLSNNAGITLKHRQTVLNIKEKDIVLATEEIGAVFGKTDFTLPYSFALKKQTYTGTLSERLSDPKYRKAMKTVARAVCP
ncbi:MAG: hypothetical protein IJT66_01610 [Clostridia bacterium]|nr:hypothetical protein [Clostridia bacterium]